MQAPLFITQHKQSGLFKLFWKLTIFSTMIWINFNCQWTPMIDYQPLKKPTQTMIKSGPN